MRTLVSNPLFPCCFHTFDCVLVERRFLFPLIFQNHPPRARCNQPAHHCCHITCRHCVATPKWETMCLFGLLVGCNASIIPPTNRTLASQGRTIIVTSITVSFSSAYFALTDSNRSLLKGVLMSNTADMMSKLFANFNLYPST